MTWGLTAALVAGVLDDPRWSVAALVFLLRYSVQFGLGRGARVCLVLLACIGFAHGWFFTRAAERELARVGAVLAVPPASVTGWVASFPQARMTGTSFVLRTAIGGRSSDVLTYSREYDIAYGDSVVVLPRKVGKSGRTLGPGYFLGRGVDGSVRAQAGLVRLDGVDGPWHARRVLWPVHRWIRTSLASRLGYRQAVPLGLVVAERGTFGTRRRSSFQRLGIAHLIALSGFHLGLVAGALLLMTRRMQIRSGVLLATALALYVGIVGEVHSLHRALLMASVMIAARRMRRKADPLAALGFATLGLGFARPTIVLSVGFQLSVIATVAVLIWIRRQAPKKRRGWRRVWYWARQTLLMGGFVQIALVPLLLFHFGSFSTVSPIATLIFVLPVTILLAASALVPIAALLLPGMDGWLYELLGWMAGAFDRLLEVCADIAPPPLSLPAPDPVLYYAGLALLTLAQQGWLGRVIGIVLAGLSWVTFS